MKKLKKVYFIATFAFLGFSGSVFSDCGDPNECFNAGLECMDSREFDMAATFFKRALNLSPENIYYRYALSVSIGANGNYEGAIEGLKEVVKEKPDFALAWNYLRFFWLKSNNLTEAKDFFAKFLKKYPENPQIYLNYAYILFELEDLENALSNTEKAIELRKSYAEAYFLLGNIHRKNFNLNEAEKSYLTAIKYDPEFAEAYLNLGLTKLDKDENSDEVNRDYFEKALTLKPFLSADLQREITNREQRKKTLAFRQFDNEIKTVTVVTIKLSFTKSDNSPRHKKEKKDILDQILEQARNMPIGSGIIEVSSGTEKRVFDWRATPNFYLKYQRISDASESGKLAKLIIRKIPDINLRFDPEGVIIGETEPKEGYEKELTKSSILKITDVSQEKIKVKIISK